MQITEREVAFKTADDWTIRGVLSVSASTPERVPAVILLHSFDHDQDTYGQYVYPGLSQIIGGHGVATLRFDFRGRGRSMGEKELHSFNAEELSRLKLDVRAAIEFLSAEPAVDASRIGIVAEFLSAEPAVMGWDGDTRVSAMVLISGRLSDSAKATLAANNNLPLQLIVSSEDKVGFADMTDAYFSSKSRESNIEVFSELGTGAAILTHRRRASFPLLICIGPESCLS